VLGGGYGGGRLSRTHSERLLPKVDGDDCCETRESGGYFWKGRMGV
jgi:hypothetical protein